MQTRPSIYFQFKVVQLALGRFRRAVTSSCGTALPLRRLLRSDHHQHNATDQRQPPKRGDNGWFLVSAVAWMGPISITFSRLV